MSTNLDVATTYFEISTDDPIAAEKFYGELFGWSFSEGHGDPYSVITSSETGIVGGLWDNKTDSSELSRNWAIICVRVPDIKEACEKAVAAGGAVYVPVMETPDGGPLFAHLKDPAGNQSS